MNEDNQESTYKFLGESTGTCECGGAVVRVQKPCPEGRYGCLVLHLGDRCQKCGKYQ